MYEIIAKETERAKFIQSLFIPILDNLFSKLAIPWTPTYIFETTVHFSINENLVCPK